MRLISTPSGDSSTIFVPVSFAHQSADGVDADFPDATVTPFVSETEKIFEDAENECSEELRGVSRGGSLLKAPDLSRLGPEKGRLDRLHAAYVHSSTKENLSTMLHEVGRYSNRVTLGKGGAFAQYVSHTAVDWQITEVSLEVMEKVWRNLSKFDGRSKFSSWVFQIARNVVKDRCRAIANRREADLFSWKDYENEGSGCYRGASGKSANGEFEIVGGSKTSLPCGGAPDERRVKLDNLIEFLKPQDKEIVHLVVYSNYTPRELGEKFGRDAKWASNQLNRIKKILRKLVEERYPADGVAILRTSRVSVRKGNLQTPNNLKDSPCCAGGLSISVSVAA
jgi:RNA polymerase sigma factor (sigma-70 family)